MREAGRRQQNQTIPRFYSKARSRTIMLDNSQPAWKVVKPWGQAALKKKHSDALREVRMVPP